MRLFTGVIQVAAAILTIGGRYNISDTESLASPGQSARLWDGGGLLLTLNYLTFRSGLSASRKRVRMPVTVLLTNTNWWPCSAHVAMALSKSGCQVDAVYPRRGHPLSKTSIVSGRFAYNAVSPVKSLFDAIRQSSPDLIVPCDDRAVVHLHRLHTHAMKRGKPYAGIREIIAKSLGSPAAFPIVARRETLLRTALEEGNSGPADVVCVFARRSARLEPRSAVSVGDEGRPFLGRARRQSGAQSPRSGSLLPPDERAPRCVPHDQAGGGESRPVSYRILVGTRSPPPLRYSLTSKVIPPTAWSSAGTERFLPGLLSKSRPPRG